jgi:hypothetical protein
MVKPCGQRAPKSLIYTTVFQKQKSPASCSQEKHVDRRIHLSKSLIDQYTEYQESIALLYPSAPTARRHYTASSREGSPEQPSSSLGGHQPRSSKGGHYGGAHSPRSRSPARRAPEIKNGGHYGGSHSPRSRSPVRRAPEIKLWSLQEIEAKHLELMDVKFS